MLTVLVFLSAFAYFLTGLTPSIGPGEGGFWAASAWTLDPWGPAGQAVPIVLGRLATGLFPFGSPAFRMNVLSALLTAGALPLLMAFLRGNLKEGAEGLPALVELERARARDAATAVAALLWVFSSPVRDAAAAWGPAAPALFLGSLLLWAAAARGRSVAEQRTRGAVRRGAPDTWGGRAADAAEPLMRLGLSDQTAGVRPLWVPIFRTGLCGLLGGAILSLDPRGLWAGAALLFLGFAFRPHARSLTELATRGAAGPLMRSLIELTTSGAVLGTFFVMGWTLGDLILSAVAAPPGSSLKLILADLVAGISGRRGNLSLPLFPIAPVSLRTLRPLLFPLSLATAPLAFWGAYALGRRRRTIVQGLAFFWLTSAWGPAIFTPTGGPGGASIFALLPMWYLLAVGADDLLQRNPRWLPWLLGLGAATLLLSPVERGRRGLGPLDRGADLLASLPEGASLWRPSGGALAALAYQQRVLQKRLDVRWISASAALPPQVSPVPRAAAAPVPGRDATEDAARGLYAESFEALPGGHPADGRPAGVVVRYAPAGGGFPATPAALSLGRVPLFFLGPRSGFLEGPGAIAGAPSDEQGRPLAAAAHRRLGEAFAQAGVPNEAEEEFRQALALTPNDIATNRSFGRLCLGAGEGKRAALLFTRAIAAAARGRPGLSDGAADGDNVLASELCGERASADLSEGNTLDAIDALGRGVLFNPAADELRVRLADLLEKMARPGDAAVQWEVLRDLHPEDKTYHWRLTQALLIAHQPVMAFQSVERYLGLPLTEEERRDAKAFREMLAESVSKRVNPAEF